MARLFGSLLLLCYLVTNVATLHLPAAAWQQVLATHASTQSVPRRKLQGRFLHITGRLCVLTVLALLLSLCRYPSRFLLQSPLLHRPCLPPRVGLGGLLRCRDDLLRFPLQSSQCHL